MRASRKLLHLLLRIYPPRFRQQYGTEAMRQLESDLLEAGERGRIRSLFDRGRSLCDFALAGLCERITSLGTTSIPRGFSSRGDLLGTTIQDARFAVRGFIKRPGFTVVAAASVALGVGANTAIFSVANGVLFKPLPYDEPDRVVQIVGTIRGQLDRRHSWLAYPEIEDLREGSETLAHVSAIQWWDPILYGSGEPTRIVGKGVSACFFEVFGIQPVVGRFFLPEEEELGHEPVVVLNYGFWQQRFGGDPHVVGETLDLDGVRYMVVGVAPGDLIDPFGAPEALIWRARPLEWDATRLARINHSWRAIGKLADGVTLQQAQADVDRIWNNFRIQYPESHSEDGARLVPAKEWLVAGSRTAILVLLGAVGLVLLIACANVASLFLTRTVTRGREVALRSALGAGRGRIIRQLVTEVCLLFVIGGAAGLPVAWLAMNSLLALGAQGLPRLGEVRIDWVVLAFTLGISLLSGLVFGLTAAFPAVRSDLAAALQIGNRSQAGDRRSHRLRGSLVVAEVALALVLLAGAGLLLRSLWTLQRVDPGFRPENVLTLRVYPAAETYTEAEEITNLYQDVTDRLASLPGVTAAGAINFLPMWAGQNCEFVWRDDLPFPTREDFADYDGPRCLEVRVVTPDYFRTMGISVLRGRGFADEDVGGTPPVAVISSATADLGFPGEDPLGKHVTLYETRDYLPNISREVVGVVSDVRQTSLASEGVPAIYFAHAQEPDPDRRRVMTLTVRAERDLTEVAGMARTAVWQTDHNITIDFVQTMSAVVAGTVTQPRFRTTLVLIFGGLALLLAMVGVAGVVGHCVSQRIPEIGIRIALGANNRDIYAAVMSQGIRLTIVGLLVGLGGALVSTRVLASLLYGVPANDPLSFGAASLLMALIALVAIWVPARRAMLVDPVKTLNAE